ncbi:MAG: hypothetical protein FWE72_07615, partial [Spirochaetaceae bacterium]|nr:hypothetical protein [Spirochaetaceae bacterium]
DGDLSMFDGSMILLRKNGISNMANAFLITIRNYGFTEKDPGTPPGLYYYHKDTSSIAYYDLMIVETSDYLLIIFVRFSGNDDGGGDEKIINVANGAQWYAALDEIGNDSSGQTDYVINITNHIMVDPYYGFGFGFRTNIKVTINGDYNTISLLNGATGNLLYIRNGQNITLNNVNLKGLENNSEELVYVGGGYLKMMGNSSISNNNSGAFGYGGGVYVSNSGYFELTGNASIHDNKAKNGGGVYVLSGTFNMLGGSIHDNTASDTGGGVYISKNNSGSFEKTGGVIEDNTADTGIDRTKGNNVMVFISYMDPPYFKARHENASSETDLNSETDDGWDYIDL